MPRPPQVSEADLKALMDRGITDRQGQADELNRQRVKMGLDPITIHAIDKARQRYDLTEYEHPDYSWAHPWQILPEDLKTTELQYLNELAAFAEGTKKQFALVNTASRWLKKIFDAGLDIRYDSRKPKGERWVTFPADKGYSIDSQGRRDNWHVRMLIHRVRDAAKGQRPRGK